MTDQTSEDKAKTIPDTPNVDDAVEYVPSQDAPGRELPKEHEPEAPAAPEGWENVPASEGGGIRPTTVPWKGYTG